MLQCSHLLILILADKSCELQLQSSHDIFLKAPNDGGELIRVSASTL